MSQGIISSPGDNHRVNSKMGARNNVRNQREVCVYAGKVHVRGLLRRVWRPRYMALGDDGYLRYHESIPPLFEQDPHRPQQHNPYSLSMSQSSNIHSIHHTHRPKSILAILDGARTIDPYSVVDRHVALPQGVHGFVFRGRPIEVHTTLDSNNVVEADVNDSEHGQMIIPPVDSAVSPDGNAKLSSKDVVNLVFPKGTARRRTAQKIAKKAFNPDVLNRPRPETLCGIARSANCGGPIVGGDISRNSSSSSLMVYEPQDDNDGYDESNHGWGRESHESHDTMGSFQPVEKSPSLGDHHPHLQLKQPKTPHGSTKSAVQVVQVQASTVQSREYLCAVSTAEEAESWVVALRWAAEHRRELRYGNPTAGGDRNDFAARSIDIPPEHDARINEEQDNDLGASEDSDIVAGETDMSNSAHKGSVAGSKASLSSLQLEQEGWCKTEQDKADDEDDKEDMLLAPPDREHPVAINAYSGNGKPTKLESSTPTASEKKQEDGATIVVTKVSRFRLPERALVGLSCCGTSRSNSYVPWFPFYLPLPGDGLALQYEIQLLLLRNCKPRTESSVTPEIVEGRTICKSMQDVLCFVRGLLAEFRRDKQGYMSSGGEGCVPEDTLILLEDIETKLMSHMSSMINAGDGRPTRGSISELSSVSSDSVASASFIDDVMRKLSKDRDVCSSRHFQVFLGIDSTSRQCTSIDVSKHDDAKQIVRNWLAKVDQPNTTSNGQLLVAASLRHHIVGPCLSLMVLWMATKFSSSLWNMIAGSRLVVTVPIETYIALLAMSFFLGNDRGISYRPKVKHEPKMRVLSPAAVKKAKEDGFSESMMSVDDDDHSTIVEDERGAESPESDEGPYIIAETSTVSSPLPLFPANHGLSCWSQPDHKIFLVRGPTYLDDRVKMPSAPAVFPCRGVDLWITDNAERNISRHPSVLGGKLHTGCPIDSQGIFIANFLLPFGNFVSYFTVPPVADMPPNIADVWCKFVKGDQYYRDRKLKLLPVVVDGPWIVKKAVGPGTAPAMVGRDLPLQYYFTESNEYNKAVYEVDILVTASRIARGILNVVKGHTKSLTIAFAFIIEASEMEQLPETVLCAFQVHSLHLEDCPELPDCYPDG